MEEYHIPQRDEDRKHWNLLVEIGNRHERLREAVMNHDYWRSCPECCAALGVEWTQ